MSDCPFSEDDKVYILFRNYKMTGENHVQAGIFCELHSSGNDDHYIIYADDRPYAGGYYSRHKTQVFKTLPEMLLMAATAGITIHSIREHKKEI